MHWNCDACGGVIRRAEDGYLTANESLTHWIIVHARTSCDMYRDGPWHPLDDFHGKSPFIRTIGFKSGARFWQQMVRDGAFSALDAEEIEVLRLRVFTGDGVGAKPIAAPRAVTEPQTIGLTLRFQILKRDGYRCQICGRSAQDGVVLEIDHKHPRSRGGTNHPSNLWVLCFDCNRGKRTEDL